MAWTYQYADGTTGDTPWKMGADGQYDVKNEGVVQYNTPGSTGYSGADITGMMGYSGGAPAAGVAPSGGSTFGGGAVYDGTLKGGGMSTGGASSAGQNPYLESMAQNMTNQMTDNFNRRVMPQIASSNLATGGYGGSRRGVIEANAMNDLNQQIGNAQTNLRGGAFNTALNYDLGLRGNDLGFAGLDAQINQNNFNNNLAGAQFGQNVWNQGMANNQTGIAAGTNIQNTPMNYWSQFANQYNGIGQGYGSTTGSTSQQGNPFMGALGGAQVGSRLGNMWGGGVGGSAGSTQDWTYGGSGTDRGPSGNIDWIYG